MIDPNKHLIYCENCGKFVEFKIIKSKNFSDICCINLHIIATIEVK